LIRLRTSAHGFVRPRRTSSRPFSIAGRVRGSLSASSHARYEVATISGAVGDGRARVRLEGCAFSVTMSLPGLADGQFRSVWIRNTSAKVPARGIHGRDRLHRPIRADEKGRPGIAPNRPLFRYRNLRRETPFPPKLPARPDARPQRTPNSAASANGPDTRRRRRRPARSRDSGPQRSPNASRNMAGTAGRFGRASGHWPLGSRPAGFDASLCWRARYSLSRRSSDGRQASDGSCSMA